MSIILNIETSGSICSVAISKEGTIEYYLEDDAGMRHAEVLAPFVDKCMKELSRKEERLNAVAVSMGPGSYTGLRIGLSLAKGLTFSCNVPLIGISTLEILAVKAMFRNHEYTGTELLVPMIDARRMEVYTGIYDFSLKQIESPSPRIIEDNPYISYLNNRKLCFIGDGVDKLKNILNHKNSVFMGDLRPKASDMLALSEKYYRENKFIDIAYSTPEYLKEYKTTTAKQKI